MRDENAWHAYRAAVGDRLRAARLRANLSQQQLADDADVSRAVVQRVEQGTGAPGLRQLWQIAGVLGVPVHALLLPADPPQGRRADGQDT